MYLIIDTEGTGFPSKDREPRDPKQARVCQLAAILCDEDGNTRGEFSTIIKPDGWSILPKASEIHGLNDSDCIRWGIDSILAIRAFDMFASKAHTLVAHGMQYDSRMMAIECAAHKKLPYLLDEVCTMTESINVCQLPKKRGKGLKSPKLAEALRIVCGREIGENAHDAMVDARACKDIFFQLKRVGLC